MNHREKWPHVASSMLMACAGLSGLLLVVDVLVPGQSKATLVADLFSQDGVVSAEGWVIIGRLLAVGRAALALGCAGGFALGVLTCWAERRTMAFDVSGEASPGWPRPARPELWLVAGFSILRLTLSCLNSRIPLHFDEMYTLERYSGLSLPEIFGFSRLRIFPNNHVMNTILVALSVKLGWLNPLGIRVWSLVSSALVVPAAWALARAAGITRGTTLAVLLGLVATSPVLGMFGHLARGYVHAILLATISVACFLQLLSGYRGLLVAGLLLSNVLLIFSCATAVVLPIAQATCLLTAALTTRPHPDTGHIGAFSTTMATLILSTLLGVGPQFPLYAQNVFCAYDQVAYAASHPYRTASGPLDSLVLTLMCPTKTYVWDKLPPATGLTAALAHAVDCALLACLVMAFVSNYRELRRCWPFASRHFCLFGIAAVGLGLAISGYPLARSNSYFLTVMVCFAMVPFDRLIDAGPDPSFGQRLLTRGLVATGIFLVMGQFLFDRIRSLDTRHREVVLSVLESSDARVWGQPSDFILSALKRLEPGDFRRIELMESAPEGKSIHFFNRWSSEGPAALPRDHHTLGEHEPWTVYQVN